MPKPGYAVEDAKLGIKIPGTVCRTVVGENPFDPDNTVLRAGTYRP